MSGRRRRRLGELVAALLRVGLSEAVAYRGEFVIWMLTTNMPLVMLALWTAVARDAPVGRYGQAEFGAYFLLAMIVRLLTGSWIVWQLTYEIRQGALNQRLLRPLHPFINYAVRQAAAIPLRVLMASPILIALLAWVGTAQLSPRAHDWLLLLPALVGSWGLTISLMLLIGSLALFWDSALSLFDLWLALYFVFSGYTIPLELFPGLVQGVLTSLPFRFLLSFPVELCLGRLTPAQALHGLALQWTYLALTCGAALWTFRRGLARYSAFGG